METITELTREMKKEEALRRMEMLEIFPETIRQFDKENLISVSEPPFGAFYYSHEWSGNKGDGKKVLTTAYDEVLNAKEAINGNPDKMRLAFQDKYGTPKPKWTGVPLKIAQKYKRGGRKYKDVWQFNMDNLPLKDGKLLFNNLYYEKTDKAGIDKEMANYKEQLKKLVGKEITSQVNNVNGKLKSIITKVTIIENDKEEVFE